MIKKCPHCGKSAATSVKVCPYCGKKLPEKKAPSREYILRYDELDSGLTDPKRIHRKNVTLTWLCILGTIALLLLLIVLFADRADAASVLMKARLLQRIV